jgi:DMSO/TMAO reductase YedYZ molybdopterin-dependent catalytic subunit
VALRGHFRRCDNEGVSIDEKNIGRRAFIGLILAGIVALFVGKDIFPRVTGGGGSSSGGAGSFRINSVETGPPFDEATWRMTVDGLVGDPFSLTFSQFTDLPQVKITRDFLCVEGWGVTGVEWKGVAVKELMQRAGIDPQATDLVFHAGDGIYADSLTLEQANLDDVLLVHELNGAPLPPNMGQPVRLIYPGHYGYKYVKWVERVEAINSKETPFTGYWEKYGYSADATIP